MHPNKFLLKRIYGLEEVVWKIPRRLFSAWSSFVSKWNERSIYEYLFGLKHPIKFLLMRTYGLEEDVVRQISRLLFSSWPSWYLNLIWASMFAWFLTRGHMVLKKQLLEEFQDGCLMHGHLWYLNGMIWAIHALYKHADGFLNFEQLRKVTLPHSVFQTCTQPNLSILIGIIPHVSTLNIILWRNNISVSVMWTNPINIKVNCHVLSQQLNCFRLKLCNRCLWIWRLSTWLVTSSYAVLMIQAWPYSYRDGEGDTVPENFGIYSVIEHDRVDFFTSKGRIRVVMYMPCVKCSCSELKLAKHLHTFFVLTLNWRNPVLCSIWLRSSSQSKALFNIAFGLILSKVNHLFME